MNATPDTTATLSGGPPLPEDHEGLPELPPSLDLPHFRDDYYHGANPYADAPPVNPQDVQNWAEASEYAQAGGHPAGGWASEPVDPATEYAERLRREGPDPLPPDAQTPEQTIRSVQAGVEAEQPDLEELRVVDLRARARDLGIEGMGNANRDTLIAAIRDHQGQQVGGFAAEAPQTAAEGGATLEAPRHAPTASTASTPARDAPAGSSG